MSTQQVHELARLLEHRDFRVDLVRDVDGVRWRGTVRSVRRVVWCFESTALVEVFSALSRWLEADTHRLDCRCRICLDRLEIDIKVEP